MTVEEFIQPGMIGLITAGITGFFAINIAFFKWLSSSFNKLATAILHAEVAFRGLLDNHEDKDQSRHEENLYRFEKIAVALAKLGADNGTH